MSGIDTLRRAFSHLLVEEHGVPPAALVLAPGTVAEVAAVLAAATEHSLIVLPWGAGTHQGLGGRVQADVVLVTTRLVGMDWHPENLTVTVGAGVRVADLETRLAERRQTSVLPESPGAATVGGCVAAGVSGWRRLRFGPTRDRVLEVLLATGDGRVVRGGAPVVKNVSGYGLSRLFTGSLGSLGVIARVCLKLWPVPPAAATVETHDPENALERLYRPLAVIEAVGVARAYLAGEPAEVESQASLLGGRSEEGHLWPAPLCFPVEVSVRVPPSLTREAVRRLGGAPYRAAFGVGEVAAGYDDPNLGELTGLRSWAELHGGAVVVLRARDDLYARFDSWGTPPSTVGLQRRIKAVFDPAGVMCPGRLPGGI